MTSEITYAEVRFKQEPKFSAGKSAASAASKLETGPHKSDSGFSTIILASLLVLLLLLAISFFLAFIIFFQKYSQLNEKKTSKEVIHTTLECMKGNSSTTEEKEWDCCPKNWLSFSSYCYFISASIKDWAESEKNCLGMKAHLLVFHSKDEQDFIIQNVDQGFAYFIGLSDIEKKSNWQWVDQTPYNKNTTYWHSTEPSQPSDGCAALLYRNDQTSWGLNDVSCEEAHRSICKIMKIYL